MDEAKAAYQRLEEAVNEVNRIEGAEGVLTEWVVVAATQRYDEDGDGITQIGLLVPGGGGQVPYHRLMGLVDYAHARMRREICEDD